MTSDIMIRSAANPRIKLARKLQRRRGRHQHGLLLVEGLRLVRDAWAAGVRPVTLFVAPEQLAGNDVASALIDAMTRAGVEVLSCTVQVFAELAETVTPQGIAAMVPLPALPIVQPADLLLILDRVRDPGNAGTLVRTAEAVGVHAVLFGPETVDPFNDKVVRAGMGAHFRVPIRVCDTWDAVTAWLPADMPLYLAEADATLDYAAVAWRDAAALVIGGEADGAGEAARAVATPIAIPMLGRTESLNAAVAGSAILFEAARQRRLAAAGPAVAAR